MSEDAKKGLWSKIFRVQKSGCCSMRIEEETERAPGASADPGAARPEETTARKAGSAEEKART